MEIKVSKLKYWNRDVFDLEVQAISKPLAIFISSGPHLSLKYSSFLLILAKLEIDVIKLLEGQMDAFTTTGLSSLRSQEQLDLLDEIDALSRSGIGEHISLP